MLYLYYSSLLISRRIIMIFDFAERAVNVVLGKRDPALDTDYKSSLLPNKVANKLWAEYVFPWARKNPDVFKQTSIVKARTDGTGALMAALVDAWLAENFESFGNMRVTVENRVSVSTNYQVSVLELNEMVVQFEYNCDLEQLVDMLS